MARYKPQDRNSLLLSVVLSEQIVPCNFAFALDYLVDHELDHTAKFVCNLRDQIQPLFSQVLMTCDSQGLIERKLFAIDDVKLPCNASKKRSGTHSELKHRADRLNKAVNKILERHLAQDKQGEQQPIDAKRQVRVDPLRQEAARTRDFLTKTSPWTSAFIWGSVQNKLQGACSWRTWKMPPVAAVCIAG
jgi:hypothetical protein